MDDFLTRSTLRVVCLMAVSCITLLLLFICDSDEIVCCTGVHLKFFANTVKL